MSPTPNLAHEATAPKPTKQWPALACALMACALATALAWPLRGWLHPVNTAMLYLLAVALVAHRWGRAPSVLAALVSVAAFDFCFVPPRGSFAVHDAEFILSLVVMLAVGLIISHLAEGLRAQARQAQAQVRQTQAMYQLASTLAGAMSPAQVQAATHALVASQWPGLDTRTTLFVPDERGELSPIPEADDTTASTLKAQHPTNTPKPWPANVLHAVRAAYLSGHTQESSQLDGQAHRLLLMPLQGATRMRGVMLLAVAPSQHQSLHEAQALTQALGSLVVAALERLHFVQVAHETQLEISAERLRSSILSALSHDVRTPLTALYGTADALLLAQPPLHEAARELATSVRDQALRLNHLVIKLLDMAKLQSGHVTLKREWQPLEEVIGASIQSLGLALQGHAIKVALPSDMPLAHIDAVLFERVLANVLDNACKYATPSSPILMQGEVRLDESACAQWCLAVRNEGPGFAPERIERAFELFERGTTESNVPGMGLGLAICKSIVEAHGGQISALNLPGGAEVRICLPLGQPPRIEPEVQA
jgi:two-component system sensor histidine kinase KdpD